MRSRRHGNEAATVNMKDNSIEVCVDLGQGELVTADMLNSFFDLLKYVKTGGVNLVQSGVFIRKIQINRLCVI